MSSGSQWRGLKLGKCCGNHGSPLRVKLGGQSTDIALLTPPSKPCISHLLNLAPTFWRNWILMRDSSQSPEPMVRLLLQVSKNQRQNSFPHPNDQLICRMHGKCSRRRSRSSITLPLRSQFLELFFQPPE